MFKVLSVDGDTLDHILNKHVSDHDDELENLVYELNPHLAHLPAVLSAGVEINIPQQAPKPKEQKRLSVWD